MRNAQILGRGPYVSLLSGRGAFRPPQRGRRRCSFRRLPWRGRVDPVTRPSEGWELSYSPLPPPFSSSLLYLLPPFSSFSSLPSLFPLLFPLLSLYLFTYSFSYYTRSLK